MSAVERLKEMAAKYHRLSKQNRAAGEVALAESEQRVADMLDAEVKWMEQLEADKAEPANLMDLIGE